MEPLFTTETEYTLKEYKTYTLAVMKNDMRLSKVSNIVFIVIISICIMILLLVGAYQKVLGYVALVLGVCLLFLLFVNQSIKKTWKSNTMLNGLMVQFSFYEDRMDAQDQYSNASVPYDKFYNILETKTNFYLMIAKNQGYIINKANCSKELVSFLQEKSSILRKTS